MIFLMFDFVPPKQADIQPSGFTVSSTEEAAMTGCTMNPTEGLRTNIEVPNTPQNEVPVSGVPLLSTLQQNQLPQDSQTMPVVQNSHPLVSPPELPSAVVPEPSVFAVLFFAVLVLLVLYFGRLRQFLHKRGMLSPTVAVSISLR